MAATLLDRAQRGHQLTAGAALIILAKKLQGVFDGSIPGPNDPETRRRLERILAYVGETMSCAGLIKMSGEFAPFGTENAFVAVRGCYTHAWKDEPLFAMTQAIQDR